MTRQAMGEAHRSPKAAEQRRTIVLLALAQGPRTGVDLCDALAAACGTKANVSVVAGSEGT